MIMVKRKDKATICFKRLSSFAPKACDTITPNPWASPDAKPSTRNMIEPVAPTAARASSPKNCPTMMVSTILQNCWNRFPNNTGSEKKRINFSGFPVVISFVIIISSFQNFLQKCSALYEKKVLYSLETGLVYIGKIKMTM